MTGKFYICSLSKMKDVPKENNTFYLITAGQREIKDVKSGRWLAPTPQLFNRYLTEWKADKSFQWWPEYRETYLSSVNPMILNDLKRRVDTGENITLMCYCGDETHCHRVLIKELLSQTHEVISI